MGKEQARGGGQRPRAKEGDGECTRLLMPGGAGSGTQRRAGRPEAIPFVRAACAAGRCSEVPHAIPPWDSVRWQAGRSRTGLGLVYKVKKIS